MQDLRIETDTVVEGLSKLSSGIEGGKTQRDAVAFMLKAARSSGLRAEGGCQKIHPPVVLGSRLMGDAALESDSDFLSITETRLIPARSRNECAELRGEKMTAAFVPCLSGHLPGGVLLGLVWSSVKGAPVSMPSIAALEFRRY